MFQIWLRVQCSSFNVCCVLVLHQRFLHCMLTSKQTDRLDSSYSPDITCRIEWTHTCRWWDTFVNQVLLHSWTQVKRSLVSPRFVPIILISETRRIDVYRPATGRLCGNHPSKVKVCNLERRCSQQSWLPTCSITCPSRLQARMIPAMMLLVLTFLWTSFNDDLLMDSDVFQYPPTVSSISHVSCTTIESYFPDQTFTWYIWSDALAFVKLSWLSWVWFNMRAHVQWIASFVNPGFGNSRIGTWSLLGDSFRLQHSGRSCVHETGQRFGKYPDMWMTYDRLHSPSYPSYTRGRFLSEFITSSTQSFIRTLTSRLFT